MGEPEGVRAAAERKRLQEEAVLRNTNLRFFPPATIKKLQAERGAHLRIA